MHGAWCWNRVIERLESRGHHCLSPNLPGAGNDQTPRKTITFENYIERIDQVIENNPLPDLNLVAHSMAGMLLPTIALHHKTRITKLIFLAAYVLNKGESVMGVMPKDRAKIVYESVEKSKDNTYLPDFEQAVNSYFADLEEAEQKACYRLLSPQPLAPCQHRSDVKLSRISQPIHYIRCTRDLAVNTRLAESFIALIPCQTHEIDAHHDVMLSHPEALATILEKIAG